MKNIYMPTRMPVNFFLFFIFIIIIYFFILTPSRANAVRAGISPRQSAGSADTDMSEKISSIKTSGRFVYGKSGLGENLICFKAASNHTSGTKILLTFEIHGFEDSYPKDGQALVDIGTAAAKYFMDNPGELNGCEIYIVPSANPDGLAAGNSANGKGRCQISLGVDINRDFDFEFRHYADSRNYTLSRPFAAPESIALKNLVETVRPRIVIDFHGWQNGFIGDKSLAGCFQKNLKMYPPNYKRDVFTGREGGFFSAWAGKQGARALLVEFPEKAAEKTAFYEEGTIAGIKEMISDIS